MICKCGCDHWNHLAMGFQGIVGMMAKLDAYNVPCSEEALKLLDEQLARLTVEIENQRRKATPPSSS